MTWHPAARLASLRPASHSNTLARRHARPPPPPQDETDDEEEAEEEDSDSDGRPKRKRAEADAAKPVSAADMAGIRAGEAGSRTSASFAVT